MKTEQEFFEQLRQAGLTEKITMNPNPDYLQPFYQQIFACMNEYNQEFQNELIEWFNKYDSDEVERIESIINGIFDKKIKNK